VSGRGTGGGTGVNATYSVCPNHRPGGRHVTVREQRRVFRRSRVRESLTAREQLGPAAGTAGDPALADPRWLADDGQPDGNDAGRTAVGRNYFSANVWKPALKAGCARGPGERDARAAAPLRELAAGRRREHQDRVRVPRACRSRVHPARVHPPQDGPRSPGSTAWGNRVRITRVGPGRDLWHPHTKRGAVRREVTLA
jgi:hypothetical protein